MHSTMWCVIKKQKRDMVGSLLTVSRSVRLKKKVSDEDDVNDVLMIMIMNMIV